MSMEDVRVELAALRAAELAAAAAFPCAAAALQQLDDIEGRVLSNPLAIAGPLAANPAPERIVQVAAAVADEDQITLAKVSASARSQVQFDEDGRVLGINNQPDPTPIMAFLYHTIAYRGATAHLTAADEVELLRKGRSPADIAAIRFLVRDVAASEKRTSWRLGPSFDDLAGRLTTAGIEPSFENVHAVRRHVLLSRAATLATLAEQPRLAPLPIAIGMQPRMADSPAAIVLPEAQAALPVVDLPVTPAQPATADPIVATPQGSVSLLDLVEDLIAKRGERIGKHTRRQYRSLARLLVKVAGTDNVHLMRQEHIGALFDIAARLPKSHGKSPGDDTRSLDEIIARGEAAVAKSDRPRAELIGLEAPTIDRYVTQLGAILKYARGRGYIIGDLSTLQDMREHDSERDEDKRLAFTHEDEVTLFSSPPWVGCLSEGNRVAAGVLLVHDSLYWAPLFAKYQLLSRAEATGIMLDDCITDAAIPSFWVRENELRGTKTLCRKRQTPFHPELIRLGILSHIELLRSLGFRVLFPDLVLRGQATPLGDLLDKIWAPVLDAALPLARGQSQTLHSFRKGGNTWLAAMPSVVALEVRLQLMGHTPQSVNGRHYTAPFPLDVKLAALQQLPVSTAHLQPAPIRLHSSVQAFRGQTRPAGLVI